MLLCLCLLLLLLPLLFGNSEAFGEKFLFDAGQAGVKGAAFRIKEAHLGIKTEMDRI